MYFLFLVIITGNYMKNLEREIKASDISNSLVSGVKGVEQEHLSFLIKCLKDGVAIPEPLATRLADGFLGAQKILADNSKDNKLALSCIAYALGIYNGHRRKKRSHAEICRLVEIECQKSTVPAEYDYDSDDDYLIIKKHKIFKSAFKKVAKQIKGKPERVRKMYEEGLGLGKQYQYTKIPKAAIKNP